MNRIFRIIWSTALNTWVVVSELATRRGKRSGGVEVDERVSPQALVLDRDMVEGSPPATAWPLRIGVLLALLSLYAPTQAATFNWDVNGTGVGLGGTGTWNTTSAFWSPNADGVSGPFSPWNNAALNDAVFGGTAGTVTLGVPISAHNLTFNTSGYTLTGSTLTLGGATPTITAGAGVAATINSVIAGTAGLTKAGTGSLTLNGVNTFSGTVNITGSNWLFVNADAALGAAGNGINLDGGSGLSSTGALAATRTVTLTGGTGFISGGAGSARYTGAGGLNTAAGVNLSNDTNNYTGQTLFANGSGSHGFTSIADLGVASSLGAPTTVANGLIQVTSGGFNTGANYLGDGDSSNRNWTFGGNTYLANDGTGTLTLTGNFAGLGNARANTADLNLLGVMSGAVGATFQGGVGRTITLGTANTYTGATAITNVTVKAGSLTNAGIASSLGTGSSITLTNGTLSYTGAGNTSDRTWTTSGIGSLNNDGTGALALSGGVTLGAASYLQLGGSFAGVNTLSGVISGGGTTGGLATVAGSSGTWLITGANTYLGDTVVRGGTLRAGNAQAFGATDDAIVDGGTLDLNGFSMEFTTLSGAGGSVALGTGTLTVNGGTGVSTSYAGSITGTGGLTKLGGSTQTLTGASTYTGATTIGGGTLALNFAPAGGPTSNIISGASTLNMSGGNLIVTGAAGETNTQTFNGLFVTGGSNNVSATSGAGGSTTINLGDITRTGGLVNFNLPGSGNITTTDTVLGGWATVNGTDYAKVVGGNITAFTAADYVNKDNASTWLNNEIISDAGGTANTAYFSTVSGSKQIGGLQYTAANNSTVTVGAGNTLGVDGTIIVSSSVGAFNQTITGGSLTGTLGGGVLGVQQNGLGTFTIGSQIVDNGGVIGFTKAGTGTVALTSTTSNYTGATIVSAGTLAVSSIANGGAASSIGASSAASSNLVLEGSILRYTGATTTSDRGFTLAKAGVNQGGIIDVSTAATNLTFGGLVTSADGANLTKTGAGTLTLTNAGSDYTGTTTVSGGILAVSTLANGGLVSSIGASSNASSNLVLNGGTLDYTGGTTSTDRGFTVGVIGAGGAAGTVGVSNAASTLTMSGTVIGDDGFIKSGAGTLVLSGINTYTGNTFVNAGTLRAGSTQAFGSTGNWLTVAAGATADLNNFATTIGGLVGAGNVTLGSATLTSSGGSATFTGNISGTGGFTRTGPFTQTLSGCNNTYTGATIIQGSNLSVDCLKDGGVASGIGQSTSASANLSISGGTLVYTGGNQATNRGLNLFSGVGAINVTNAAATLEFSGTAVGPGYLQKDGAGTLVMSGNNTYTGGTQVNSGILRAGSATAFGTAHLSMANTAGAVLDTNGFNLTFTALSGGGTTGGNINLGAQTLTLSNGNSYAYAGNINGTGSLIKNGAGIQYLSGCNNTYTGTTTINGGWISTDCLANGGSNSGIGASSAAAGNLTLSGGGTLQYTGAATSSDRLFTLGAGGGALDASGTGALNLTNTGLIAQTGLNSTLTLTGTNTGTNILSAQLNNGAGTSGLTKTGTGTWRLTNNNSAYTGVTTISGGVLEVSQMANGGVASGIGASSNAASNLIIGSGATLRYTGAGDSSDRQFTLGTGTSFIESSGTGAINFTNIGAVTLQGTNAIRTIALGGTNTGNNTFAGSIGNNGTGVTTLAKNDSGNWILIGNNTYTGNTVINDGNLTIGNGGTSGNLGTGSVNVVNATSTLSINRSDTVIFNTTMSGLGGFAQIGTGTTTLTANSDIGSIRVSAGTLDVNGTLTSSTIAMTGTSTLNVDGTVQTAGGTAAVITGDAGNSTISVSSTGTLRANGDLGGGTDALIVAGTLDTGAAALSLGAGNDSLTLNDGAVITGAGVDGGAGTADNLIVNNALALSFGGTGVAGFEQLTKNNVGVLTLTSNQSYSAGTVINGGTLDVNATLDTSSVTMAGGSTLNVDGTVEGMGAVATTITGTAGVETINVNSGATLRANGDLGDGVDNVTLFGTLDTGASALSLGAGNESFTLRDGAALIGVGIDGGTGTDQLVLNNALAMTFNGSQTAGFETLVKQNTGIATMTGAQSFIGGTTLSGGTLDVDGALTTPTVGMADGTTLRVDGSVQAGVGTAAVITGSTGVNLVTVGAGGTLLANGDLGDGADVLDVFGTLNTGGGTFALGLGNDTLTIHDGTNIIGTVNAGAGTDTFNANIATNAVLGAVQGFETLSKTGVGVLDINGPGSTDFSTVNVLAGTLHVGAGGTVVPTTGLPQATTIAAGATLAVDGNYGCGTNNDTMNVSGTVSGTGTIDLCGGDDTLTLNDGAVLNNTISGGANGAGDRVVLNNTTAFTLDVSDAINFEFLTKNNAGIATLTGDQIFTGGITLNGGTLGVAAGSSLETPTLVMADGTTFDVDGFANGGPLSIDTIAITGSSGVNTVSVGAGGYLAVSGTSDLGAGNDVLDVAGSLDVIGGGGTFNLGDGDDRFIVYDTTSMTGGVDAGAGTDLLQVDVSASNVVPLGSLIGFESLGKSGLGELQINGASSFVDVEVLAGTLNVTATGSVSATNTTVFSGAILNIDGSYTGTAGTDIFTVAGTVMGTGTIDLQGGNDTFTIQDGADLSGLTTPVDGGAGIDTLTANLTGSATLGGTVNFETLNKTNTGTLNVDAASSFTTVNVNGGTLDISATGSIDGVQNANVVAGANLIVDGALGFTPGADTFTVAGGVSGVGTIDMLDGDDTLTLNDGANLSGFTGTLDGGAGTGDTVVLNNALAMTFGGGAVNNFEALTKNGVGEATLTGTQAYNLVTLNQGTLTVDAAAWLQTSNLNMADNTIFNVEGFANGGPTFIDYINITGSSGTNTVIVAGGAALTAAGDLGDGVDVLDVAGFLDTAGNTLYLGAGNDRFIVHDDTTVLGGIDAGADIDLLEVDVSATKTVELGSLNGFESLGKSGLGTLQIDGVASFNDVEVLAGLLNVIGGASVSAINTTLSNGATLNIDGAYTGTNGNDTFIAAGTITGTGPLDLLDGDDSFTLQDGADLSGLANAVDGGAGTDTLTADLTGNVVLNGAVNFETLTKSNTGTLNIDGPAVSSFTNVNVNGGTLDIGAAGSIDGVVNTTVASGATLNVDGSYTGSNGNDTMTVAGIVDGTGSINLGDGDDILTLTDGAVLNNIIDGGNHVLGDTVVLDNTGVLTLNAVSNFEFLTKNNVGEAILTGSTSFTGGTTINGGLLTVTGDLTTPTVDMADGTTLAIDGSLSAGPVDPAIITGSAGSNTVTINGTALITGDLGGGDDLLDVAGVLDTGSGTFGLGDGDDSFLVHDGTVVTGIIDGGAGLDTRIFDINLTADVGALLNFEGITKTGTGTLNINGPGATDLQNVDVLGGTLNIAAGASVIATPGQVLATVIASGAILNVDGSYGCGAGNDTMDVSGMVQGTGTVDLCGGDDTLTLNDGAALNNVIDGGANGTGDTVVLNNANALTFDAGDTINFEILQKDNTGTATLTGTQVFIGGTTINGGTLDVDGTLETPTVGMGDDTTLNVDGLVQAAGGTAATITGSAGINTVTVNGTLIADGNLGNGNDVLDVFGTLDTAGGTFALGDGDDRLIVHDTTAVFGAIDAGLGIDLLEVDVGFGNTVPLGALAGFESLGKSGLGTLQINGPSSFIDVDVLAGTLDVAAGGSVAAQNTTLASGSTLNLDGSYTGTTGTDTFTVAGTITGPGTLDLLDGNDTFTIQDGANLSGLTNPVDGGAGTDAFVADLTGSATLGGAINFETLTKTNTGTLNIDGPAASAFTTVNVDGGTLDIGLNGSVSGVQSAAVAAGASLVVDGALGFTPGTDSFTIAGNVSGSGSIDMLAGDDTLTLNDGTDMSGFSGTLDGGADTDTVVLNNALAMSFGAGTVSNFEFLTKNNTGIATLVGTQNFSGGTAINGGTLDVDGSLETPTIGMGDDTTLNVDGLVQGVGGIATTITGSAGTNTVTVSGTLAANGGLGDGEDVLDVLGTLDTKGGVFSLGDGDDSFVVHDGTNVIGIIDGGAGLDTRVYDINLTADLGALVNFEGLTKTGTGTLNINGPGATELQEVDVVGGTLNVGPAAIVAAQTTTVGAGTTLQVDGSYTGTTGNDTMTVAGTVAGTGTVALLDGDDTFTIQDGADLSGLANPVDGGVGTDTFLADITGSATLGGAINFETLTKTNVGTLNIDGPATSAFTTVNVDGGTIDVGLGGVVNDVVTTTVASGATLNVEGSYGCGASDGTMDVSGTVSGGGTIDMCGGEDTLILNDGAVLTAVISGGANGTGDTVVLNNANALTFDASNTVNFEFLQKDNTGTATLTGAQIFTGGTAINGGTLDVDGALQTPTVTLADDTTLNVDGSLQGAGATPAAAITGSAGVNTVIVNGTLLANGDLGAGNDVLDVVGTLDTVGGTFALGDGDDSFVVHDGTNVIGTIDGGAGLDTRVYDINLTADLGALVNFEGVTKTGTGTLNINGPAATGLQEVSVLGGTLNVAAGASVVATAGNTLDTVVASGATLNVDGSFGCGDGNDTMDVSGTVSGTGTIDLCGGDDTLTLNDGAVLANVIDGGANGTGDTVVLNNAGALTFDGASTTNFEILQKDNTGTATLTGTQSFSGGTAINGGTLDVDGSLTTPTVTLADDTTLNVDGLVQNAGGTAATITGSAGVNTVIVTGTLIADGDLGDGDDVLDLIGTLDTAGGTFALGDGDDRMIVHDTTSMLGAVNAGLGNDMLEVNLSAGITVPLGALGGFESLGKSGLGTLQINGPSSFIDVEVLGGTLDVSATGSVSAQNTTVFSGATLNLIGNYTGTAGDDSFTVAGTVTGTGTVSLLGGNDTFTVQDGANLAGLTTPVDGGDGTDTVVADIAGSATLGGAVNFETLTKTNIGTLNIDGPAASAFTTVNVNGGTVDVGVNGSMNGVVTTTVASGATLNVDGSFTGSSGTDTMTVAGTVSGSGTVALLDGDDTLVLQDGADTSGLVNAIDGGAGTDTVNADVASTMVLGPTVNFETLQKTGVGELTLQGSQAYVTTQVDAGTLMVASGTTLASQNTTVATGSTLDVQGTFAGTPGDDTFTSMGTVIGALGFGTGNDDANFIGGNIGGLTTVDGGAGGTDTLSFSGLNVDTNVLAMSNWERVDLLNDSSLVLRNALNLGTGVLAIDATSQLFADVGASITGSVENAGRISVDANRLAISGGYSANNGALQLMVSPGTATSGGLDVAGDVTGTTAVTFVGDGSEVFSPQQPTSILVISSPNDNLATAGSFTPAGTTDGVVRLQGSVMPWTFSQQADKSWYLGTEAAGVLPEIGGYAALSSIGHAGIQDSSRLLSQRMSTTRGDAPSCHANSVDNERTYAVLTGDCHGFWMAANASELEMGANPGFAFSGDSVGLYMGADVLLQDRGTRTLRGGAFVGFQRGDYWTSGANSTDLQATDKSNVRTETPTFGLYSSVNWRGGTYADVSLVAQLPKATIGVPDGFRQQITGNSLTLSTQVGHRFALDNGWTLEPQVQLSAIAMGWGNTVDASGKDLFMGGDVMGTARAAVRAEKTFEMSGGARVRTWTTLGLQDTLGERQEAFTVMAPGPGAVSQAFPNHDLGLNATLDVGAEVELNQSVSLFGTLSYDKSLQGTDSERRQANVGVRIKW